ncbi:MAG: dephospho-CoA kinase, partial [Oscillospiraceae bacterium]|nr:dephospho-CoA kinase [Oscillospiraceae bacterium]
MKTIGITGGTGAGKTSALRALEKLGAYVIDCDEVYGALLRDNADMGREMAERFPEAISEDGIDRRVLARTVFADPAALEELNAITHKYVAAEVANRLELLRAGGGRLAAVDAIALIESGLHELCDTVVGVTAPAERRLERIMARDGIDDARARMRIGAQRTDTFFRRNCDHILVNDCAGAEEFEEKCAAFFGEMIH